MGHEGGKSRERRHRREQAGELHGRHRGQDPGSEERGHLAAREARDDQPVAGHRRHVEQSAEQQNWQPDLQWHAEQKDRHREQAEEAHKRHHYVRQLLAEQEFQSSDRRYVEICDRAELLLPHDANGHENRRDEGEQHRDRSGHHREHAPKILVVTKTGLDRRKRCRRGFPVSPGEVGEVGLVHAAQIAARRLRPKWHCAVDPGADLGRGAARDIATEARRYLQSEQDVAGLQPPLDISVCVERSFFLEIRGPAQLL
jgi:hypothetical protein